MENSEYVNANKRDKITKYVYVITQLLTVFGLLSLLFFKVVVIELFGETESYTVFVLFKGEDSEEFGFLIVALVMAMVIALLDLIVLVSVLKN